MCLWAAQRPKDLSDIELLPCRVPSGAFEVKFAPNGNENEDERRLRLNKNLRHCLAIFVHEYPSSEDQQPLGAWRDIRERLLGK